MNWSEDEIQERIDRYQENVKYPAHSGAGRPCLIQHR